MCSDTSDTPPDATLTMRASICGIAWGKVTLAIEERGRLPFDGEGSPLALGPA